MQWVVGAALATVAGAGWAQDAAPPLNGSAQGPGFTLQVTSQLVVLDVVVTDKKGASVLHLLKDDFTVYEGKVPQVIRSFEEVAPPPDGKAAVAVNSTAELDRLEPRAPVSIVVIDELTTRFEDLAFARYSLKRYLNTQGDTLEQPTMLIAANYRNIAVLRDYTTSKKEILDALDHHIADYGTLAIKQADPNSGGQAVTAAFASLIGVAQATTGHPGHKNMIWIGRGFPVINRMALPPDEMASLDDALASCTALLRNARVTLYTIDPAGLAISAAPNQEQVLDDTDPFGGQVNFDSMATATGGRALHGRNDVDAVIDETVRDGASFYTLAYRPAGNDDAAKPFRSIHVVMRPVGLVASAREGYFTTVAPVAPVVDAATGKLSQQAVFDLGVAGSSLLVYDGVPVTVERDAATPDLFHLKLRASGLAQQGADTGKPKVDLMVLMESFDRKGKLITRNGYMVQQAVQPGQSEVSVPESIATAAPAARVRFVVRDNLSGKLGAENFFLVDPKTISDPATGINKK